MPTGFSDKFSTRTLLIVVLVTVIPSTFLAYQQTQVPQVVNYLVSLTSANVATAIVAVLLFGAILISLMLFLFRHRILRGLHRAYLKINDLTLTKYIFLVGLLLIVSRMLILLLDYSPVTDGLWYHNTAISLMETGVHGPDGNPRAFRFPGYPFLLSLWYRIFGVHLLLA